MPQQKDPKQTRQQKQQNLYQEVTDKIINLLERVNLEDYEPPFAALAAQGLPMNPTTEQYYKGVNIPCLWLYQQEQNYTSNHWATFKQWKEQGCNVRKGQKGSTIVFYKTLVKTEENEQGEEQTNKIPMLKLYKVFNADQVEGYQHRSSPYINEKDEVEPIELADEFCANTKADIRHEHGNRAFYHRIDDYIHIPETMDFIKTIDATATENYHSTLFYELVHWSGAPHRLDRDKAQSLEEKGKYAFEELVAELGAAFLCAQLNINQSPRNDHARYILSWLQALRNDNKSIFRASAQAARAVDYLNDLQL